MAKLQIPALFAKFYLESVDQIKLFPEVEGVIESLSSMSIKQAVASQTPKEALSKILPIRIGQNFAV